MCNLIQLNKISVTDTHLNKIYLNGVSVSDEHPEFDRRWFTLDVSQLDSNDVLM